MHHVLLNRKSLSWNWINNCKSTWRLFDLKQLYKKSDVRPLTEYQKRINEEAQQICEQNPTVLRSRLQLLEAETYQFKKRKSRAKNSQESCSYDAFEKRQKLNHSARLERMKHLEEDLKNCNKRISYKEKRREAGENVKNYRICDKITEEISSLHREKRQMVDLLHRKEKQSKNYLRRKKSSVNFKCISSIIKEFDSLSCFR